VPEIFLLKIRTKKFVFKQIKNEFPFMFLSFLRYLNSSSIDFFHFFQVSGRTKKSNNQNGTDPTINTFFSIAIVGFFLRTKRDREKNF
jgi:hypothetical protein